MQIQRSLSRYSLNFYRAMQDVCLSSVCLSNDLEWPLSYISRSERQTQSRGFSVVVELLILLPPTSVYHTQVSVAFRCWHQSWPHSITLREPRWIEAGLGRAGPVFRRWCRPGACRPTSIFTSTEKIELTRSSLRCWLIQMIFHCPTTCRATVVSRTPSGDVKAALE